MHYSAALPRKFKLPYTIEIEMVRYLVVTCLYTYMYKVYISLKLRGTYLPSSNLLDSPS